MQTYDAIVIGLGAMGSAAAFHLAARKQKVLGIEQFQLAHDRGSSHGETRLIRQAYFEDPNYIPLLFRAYELWDHLASQVNQELIVRNGLVIYGRPGSSQVFEGALRSGRQYGIPMEQWSQIEAQRRLPLFRIPNGFAAAYEPGAGFLFAERCVLAQAQEARRLGAELHENETVMEIEAQNDSVRVHTSRGQYEAARVVVAGGGWNTRLLHDLGLPLTLRRMLLSWFEAGYEHVASPGFIYDLDEDFYYGFPRIDGRTIKIAGHRLFETMREPEEKDTAPMSKARIERLRDFVQNYLPCVVRPEVHRTANCIYTMTPDENFILDKHPKHPEIVIAAGFSGHGFKFAPVVGEIAADLAIEGQTRHAIDFMRLKRFYATI